MTPAITATVEPLGARFRVAPGESVMAAAQRAGLRWPTLCRGVAQCGWCHAEVTESAEPLPPIASAEARTLKLAPPARGVGTMRLACQLRPRGDIVLRRAGVMPAENAA